MIDVLDKKRQGLDPALGMDEKLDATSDKGYVFCAACSHVVAHVDHETQINGAFGHTCTNPYGITFHIGCYTEALGCNIAGERNAADTWFPGFQWRLANCAECGTHLGWYFDKPDSYFYGLITDRLQTD